MKNKIIGIFICTLLITTALQAVGNILDDNLTNNENKYYSSSSYGFIRGDYNWSIAEVVSTESSDVSEYSSCDVDSDGTIHVVWMDNTDYGGSDDDRDIFYKHRVSGGNWSNVEIVSTESYANSWFPCLFAEEDGTIHVVWYDLTDYGGSGYDSDIFYKYRSSSGIWSSPEVVSTESTNHSVHPHIAVESDGTVHVAWRDYTDYDGSGLDYDIFYKKRHSGGSWSNTEVVSTESNNHSYGASLNIDDAGTVHVVWFDSSDYGGSGSDYDIFYKQRLSSGYWSTTEIVSEECIKNSFNPTSAVEPDGTFHVAWYDNTNYAESGPDLDIFYKNRANTGSWSDIEVVSTESIGHSADPSLNLQNDGTIHVVWEDQTDYNSADTDEDIFYKQRSSNGLWSITEVVSTESTEPSSNPSSAVESDGTVHVTWDDYTDYGGSDDDGDIFYKYGIAEQPIPSIPILIFENIKGGLVGISVVLRNIGNGTAYDISWEMSVSEGFLYYPRTRNGTIDKPLGPGDRSIINIKPMMGFGGGEVFFYCKYKMILDSSRTEIDVEVKQEGKDLSFLFGHAFLPGSQPTKEWIQIDSFEYKEVGFDKYVELIFKDITNMHNVRVIDSGSKEIMYQGACCFQNGVGTLEEGWLTKSDIEQELAYWEVELLDGE